jgi:hypothetical protein
VFLIELYNEICFAKDMRRMCFGEGVQTTFWMHKLELFPKFKELATMT